MCCCGCVWATCCPVVVFPRSHPSPCTERSSILNRLVFSSSASDSYLCTFICTTPPTAADYAATAITLFSWSHLVPWTGPISPASTRETLLLQHLRIIVSIGAVFCRTIVHAVVVSHFRRPHLAHPPVDFNSHIFCLLARRTESHPELTARYIHELPGSCLPFVCAGWSRPLRRRCLRSARHRHLHVITTTASREFGGIPTF